MGHRILHSFLIALLCLSLTGCWNRRELNELAITVGIAIDKVGKEYRISAQVVEPGEVASPKGGSKRSPVTLYQAKSTSMLEAIREMTKETPRRIYLAHLRILILSEQLAKETGVADVIDFFARSHETREDFYIVIGRDRNASEMLQVLTPLESIPANSMFTSLKTSIISWAPTTGIHLDELIRSLVTPGISLVLPGLETSGDIHYKGSKSNVEAINPPLKLKFSGLGVFNKDKLIGWLNEEESKGYNYIRGNVTGTAGHSKCPEGGVIISEVVRTKSNMKANIVNGNPSIDIHLIAEGDIAEVNCNIDLTSPGIINQLQSTISKDIAGIMQSAVDKSQDKLKVDVLGFGAALHRSHPKIWKRLEPDWENIFPSIPVQIKVDYKIRRTGDDNNSFVQDIKR